MTASDDPDRASQGHVPKFTGDPKDWMAYKTKITLFLERFDLETMAFGEDNKGDSPDLTTPEEKRKSKKARAMIMLGLPDDVISLVEAHKTAHSVMQELRAHFERKCRGSLILALKLWWKLEMRPTETVTSWVSRVQIAANNVRVHHITDEKKDLFSQLTEQDVVNRIIAGLSDDYDALLTTIDQTETEQSMATMTIPKITALIMNIAASIQGRNDQLHQTQSANRASIHIPKKEQESSFKEQSNSWREAVAAVVRAEIAMTKPIKKCRVHLRSTNHDDSECFTQHPELKIASNKQNTWRSIDAYTAIDDDTNSEKADEDWLLDSGCSAHMSWKDSFMTDLIKVPTMNVSLGNDRYRRNLLCTLRRNNCNPQKRPVRPDAS
jgi:hypothetical protein